MSDRPFALLGLLTLLIMLSLDCAPGPTPLDTDGDFIGFISEIHPRKGRDAPGEIFVESHADKIVTRYTIRITDRTIILRQEGDDLRRVGFKTLEKKQWVEVWWAGPTTGSLPVHGTAAQIVVQ